MVHYYDVATTAVLHRSIDQGAVIQSDEALVVRVRAGDKSAFEILYDRYAHGVLTFCVHMLGSREWGEDALQMTLVSAYRGLLRGDCSDGGSLRPWLYTIARNRCLSELRARREIADIDGVMADRPSIDDPGSLVERREQLREMVDDIQRLPQDQRAALVLFELGDQSHMEIASVLDVRPEKVKALIFQAREGLLRARKAREGSCSEVQEHLASVRGKLPARGMVRAHIERCAACTAFEHEVRHQRAALALVIPVAPTAALKFSILSSVLAHGGAGALGLGGAAGTGGAAVSSLSAGAASAGAVGVAATGGATGGGAAIAGTGGALAAGASTLGSSGLAAGGSGLAAGASAVGAGAVGAGAVSVVGAVGATGAVGAPVAFASAVGTEAVAGVLASSGSTMVVAKIATVLAVAVSVAGVASNRVGERLKLSPPVATVSTVLADAPTTPPPTSVSPGSDAGAGVPPVAPGLAATTTTATTPSDPTGSSSVATATASPSAAATVSSSVAGTTTATATAATPISSAAGTVTGDPTGSSFGALAAGTSTTASASPSAPTVPSEAAPASGASAAPADPTPAAAAPADASATAAAPADTSATAAAPADTSATAAAPADTSATAAAPADTSATAAAPADTSATAAAPADTSSAATAAPPAGNPSAASAATAP
jgi:RNA polymerase sigma factor (sigma-70 family)